MKKLVSSLVAALLIFQSLGVFAVDYERHVDVDADLKVTAGSAGSDSVWEPSITVGAGEGVAYRATLSMENVKAAFNEYYTAANALFDISNAQVKGEFSITADFAEGLTVPESFRTYDKNNNMNGFDDAAKAAYKETNRTYDAAKNTVTIEFSVKGLNDEDYVLAGDLAKNPDVYFPDFQLICEGVVALNSGEYTSTGALSGLAVTELEGNKLTVTFAAKGASAGTIEATIIVTNIITKVEGAIETPTSGSKIPSSITPPADAKYEFSDLTWDTDDRTFMAGKTYEATVTVRPKDGYELSSEDLMASFNDDDIKIKSIERNDDGTYTVTFTVTVPDASSTPSPKPSPTPNHSSNNSGNYSGSYGGGNNGGGGIYGGGVASPTPAATNWPIEVLPPPSQLNSEDHFAYVLGYPEGDVRPGNNITRQEVATIFFRLLSDDYRSQVWSQTNSFTDVAADSWSNNAISTMANAGIITGDPDGRFRPADNITRAEFAAIAARFDTRLYTGGDRFTDISGHWAAEYINKAASRGWISGDGNGTFRPNDKITRAEAFTLVNNVLNRHVTESGLLSDMVTWTDNSDPNAWYYTAVQEATNSHHYERAQGATNETWTEISTPREWSQLEMEWSNANGAE